MNLELLKLSSNVNECKPLVGGQGGRTAGRDTFRRRGTQRGWLEPGKAVQVGPMKPTLNAPGTKRLKLKLDELL